MLLYIEYGILFVDTVDTRIKACNALNAMFVKTVDTTVKTHPHIPAHNFLNPFPARGFVNSISSSTTCFSVTEELFDGIA